MTPTSLTFAATADRWPHRIAAAATRAPAPAAPADRGAAVTASARRARPEPADEARLQSWIAGIARRDEKSLGLLYDATVARIHGLVLRLLRDPQAAEEVTVDTYWQAWRQATRFDPARGNAMAWLLTIARSRALDAIRARDPALHGALGDEEMQLDQLIDDRADDPVDRLQVAGEQQRLQQALATLDPLSRQMVALAFFRGSSHEEIAAHLGLPLGTVKSRIRRALARLRECLPLDQHRSGS